MNFDYKAAWKALANERKNTVTDHITYCLFKAMNSKVESFEEKREIAIHLIRKALPPVTTATKLANGRSPFDTITYYGNNGILAISTNFIFGQDVNKILTVEEIEELKALRASITRKDLIRKYSYFFTRQDMFEEYQLVQTSHAALELGAAIGAVEPESIKGLHFTCCGVSTLYELEEVEKVLKSMKVPYVVFREPDIGNQKTAIGVFPLQEHKRGLLRNYGLLKFDTIWV